MKHLIAVMLVLALCTSTLFARVVRGVNNNQVVVQNRSAANVNRTAIVNRNANVNVNRNANVNVNRNVDVNVHRGGYYYEPDHSWNWGSFATGAAVGVATTAAVAAATRPSTTTVIAAPAAIGTIVPSLPGSCESLSSGGTVIYNCSNVFYSPYYQGTALVYRVVTYP